MIANARMYSVSPAAGSAWRALLQAIIDRSNTTVAVIEHPPPAPIEALWARPDLAAVFMCGLPYAQAHPTPILMAAPVPDGTDFADRPQYFSAMVVRRDSPYRTIADTFGARIALTTPTSQSGCAAALEFLRGFRAPDPMFSEVIGPQMTPVGAAEAVLDERADLAPIDGYAYALMARYRPEIVAGLRVIARTAATPIPVLVASPQALPEPQRPAALERLRRAFLDAHECESLRPLLSALLLRRFEGPDPGAYASLRVARAAAVRHWREHRLAAKIDPSFVDL